MHFKCESASDDEERDPNRIWAFEEGEYPAIVCVGYGMPNERVFIQRFVAGLALSGHPMNFSYGF